MISSRESIGEKQRGGYPQTHFTAERQHRWERIFGGQHSSNNFEKANVKIDKKYSQK